MSKVAYRTVIIGFILLVLGVGAGLLWGFNVVNSNISNFQQKFSEKDSLNNSIRDLKGPLIVDYSNIDSLGSVNLSENDVEKLNDHIKFLTIEIEEEYIKTQELIDSDIDRIGIMMTIIIGVLSLLLGVLPFLSNLITRQDMREEVTRLNDKVITADSTITRVETLVTTVQTTANDASSTAIGAKTTAESAATIASSQTKIVTDLTATTKQISDDIADRLPKVTVMAVHVAISRLINITNHVQNGSGPSRPSYLKSTIVSISDSIRTCKDDNLMPFDDTFLKSGLVDLYFALENWSFAIAIYGRAIQDLREPWMNCIYSLVKSTAGNIDESYNNLLDVMNDIAQELEKLN